MKFFIENIVSRSWGLMMSTSQTWEGIKAENSNRSAFKTYYVPFMLVCVSVVLVFKMLYADSDRIQTALVYAVLTVLSYMGAFFFTRYLTTRFIKVNHPTKNDASIIEKIISYSFAVVFVLKIVTTIIPSLFFLQILNIYTVYLVWEGCRVMFDMDEDERGKIMLIIGLSAMFVPALISKIVQLMLPGF